jgi:FdhE protein
MTLVFHRRAVRAEQLAGEWPFAAELLASCRDVFVLQDEMARHVASAGVPALGDTLVVLGTLLADVVSRSGPALLAEEARRTREWTAADWERLVRARGRVFDDTEALAPRDFLRLALLQVEGVASAPTAEARPSDAGDLRRTCPCCAGRPIASVLREDASAGALRRTLLCFLCATEWAYPRVACPSCGEERPERLPRLRAEEVPWLRVEGCEACGVYLKSVDLTLAPHAEPAVDELGSTPLDVLARARGWRKAACNLAGF